MEQVQHCTDLPRQVAFLAHTKQGKMGAWVGMNVTAHQEKEKNERTRTGKRKAGEERKQETDFKEAVCCPSAVVQWAAQRKSECGVSGVTGTLGKANPQPRRGRGLHRHVEAAVDWCSFSFLNDAAGNFQHQ